MEASNNYSNVSALESNWDGIAVQYCYMTATGDFDLAMPKQGISIAFIPHERATWSVDGGTSQTTAVAPGSVLLCSNRNFVWHYREKASEWIHIRLEPSMLSHIAQESGISTEIEIEHRVLFNDPTILHLAQLFKAEVVKSGVAKEIYVESLRNLLAVHLVRNYTNVGRLQLAENSTKIDSPLNTYQIKQLKDFIEEHLDQKLSIKKLAAIVHLSQFHFARAFKEAVGTTPHHYVIQRRLERAKILLTLTQASVQEIAIKVGYANKSHFTAQFRKYVGTTPAAYRNSF